MILCEERNRTWFFFFLAELFSERGFLALVERRIAFLCAEGFEKTSMGLNKWKVRAYRLVECFHLMALQLFGKTADNVWDQPRTVEDEAGVNLAEMSAGSDFFPGAFGVADAADSDDGEFALSLAGDAANDFRASFSQGLAAEASRFSIARRGRFARGNGARECCVRCHEAGQWNRQRQIDNVIHCGGREVWIDLCQEGFSLRDGAGFAARRRPPPIDFIQGG